MAIIPLLALSGVLLNGGSFGVWKTLIYKSGFSDWLWHQGCHYYTGHLSCTSFPKSVDRATPRCNRFEAVLPNTVLRRSILTLDRPCVNMKKAKWQLLGATTFIHNLYTQRYSLGTRWRLFFLFIKPQRPCFCCLSCPLHNLYWSPAQPSWWRLRSEHSCETS